MEQLIVEFLVESGAAVTLAGSCFILGWIRGRRAEQEALERSLQKVEEEHRKILQEHVEKAIIDEQIKVESEGMDPNPSSDGSRQKKHILKDENLEVVD